jgi:regulator of sigma E protease
MQTLLAVILVFVVLVFVHELGHFLFAKRAGILAREFAIGFGPKVFSVKKGETRYTFRLFPLGGFVRMAGEDPEVLQINPGQTIAIGLNTQGSVHKIYLDKIEQRKNVVIGTVKTIDLERELKIVLERDEQSEVFQVDPQAEMIYQSQEIQIAPWDRQFGSKTLGQRSMTIFAGPLFNFILAILLFTAFFLMVGIPNDKVVQLGPLSENMPAIESGLQEGDIVLEIEGEPITRVEQVIEKIQTSEGKPMLWLVQRNNESLQIKVTPKAVEDNKFLIGASIGNATESATFTTAVSAGLEETWRFTKVIFYNFKLLFTGNVNVDDLAGPIGIMDVTGDAAKNGAPTLIRWTALLSLYLGIFNLLPIPALDGSRLLFLGYEAVRGRPVDPHRESMIHFVGFALLMLLMVFVTYNDILRLFNM